MVHQRFLAALAVLLCCCAAIGNASMNVSTIHRNVDEDVNTNSGRSLSSARTTPASKKRHVYYDLGELHHTTSSSSSFTSNDPNFNTTCEGNYHLIKTSIPAYTTAHFRWSSNVTGVALSCVQGYIYDVWSGHPRFTVKIGLVNGMQSWPLGSQTMVRGLKNCTRPFGKLDSSWCMNIAPNTGFMSPDLLPEQFEITVENDNSLWNANVNLTVLATPVSGSNLPTTPPQGQCACVAPTTGAKGTDICTWYESQAWLPPAYARGAACACRLPGTPAPNSSTARCVRGCLNKGHTDGTIWTAAEQTNLAELRSSECWDIGIMTSCTPTYFFRLGQLQFARKAWKLHEKCFTDCCCPHPPAPKWAWDLVVTMEPTTAVCTVEMWAIERFGPCGCQGW